MYYWVERLGFTFCPGAWFEVTPESVARHIADRLQYERVVDGTCGVGGNAIQRLGWSFVQVVSEVFCQKLKRGPWLFGLGIILPSYTVDCTTQFFLFFVAPL